jgi:hypothetical protein
VISYFKVLLLYEISILIVKSDLVNILNCGETEKEKLSKRSPFSMLIEKNCLKKFDEVLQEVIDLSLKNGEEKEYSHSFVIIFDC